MVSDSDSNMDVIRRKGIVERPQEEHNEKGYSYVQDITEILAEKNRK